MALISVRNLKKHFTIARRQTGSLSGLRNLFSRQVRTVQAVDGVSFEIQAGEIVGYLGPNGAGKSTTIKMLSGLLVPTSGEMDVSGYLPWRDRVRYVANIGAVFGHRPTLWWDLPVSESLDMLQHLYNIPRADFQHNLGEFKTLLGLDEFLDTPFRTLSLGQRMRADLAGALLHSPRILFLDEPTIGLDVVAKERIRQFIQHIHRQRGVTILLTTHDLSDVEKLCERIMIIDRGRLLFDGALLSLIERFGGRRRLLVDFAEAQPSFEIEGARLDEADGLRITYSFERNAITASELIGRISSRYRIVDLQVREPEIEETIRRIYEEKLLTQ
jgi:ABC-2 type transport system ATP-binding protein